MQDIEFEIDRNAVERYFRTGQSALLFVGLGWYFGIGILLAFIHYYRTGPWLCSRQANALRYRVEGNILQVESGVFNFYHRSIPLERVSDIVLFQNLLMRHFGIWQMCIYTVDLRGVNRAVLYGVHDPEKVRDMLLSQRHVLGRVYVNKIDN